jgi:hypothetical protein
LHTGFFQQSFGFFWVKRILAGQVDIAGIGGRHVATDGFGQAFKDAIDEGFLVDGM